MRRILQTIGTLLFFCLLTPGCVSPPNASSELATLVKAQIGQTPVQESSLVEIIQAQNRVQTLLKQPLTADTVIEITLLNNASVQVVLEDLDIAGTDLVQALTFPIPVFLIYISLMALIWKPIAISSRMSFNY